MWNRTIIKGLKGLIKEREENFRDHIEKRKKKFIVAIQRIFHPFTVLTLGYICFLIYNTNQLYANPLIGIARDTSEYYPMPKSVAGIDKSVQLI